MAYDLGKHLSSKHCSACHEEGEGFKCPKCGYTTTGHDPLHFQKCGSMIEVKCKKCEEAESNCKCL